jgi:MoaA/NifB/PqqE/SkfB family radical SAM enzyme
MRHLKDKGITFGFSAMVANEDFGILGSEQFIDQMTELGCALGFYTEYVPLGSAAKWELVMEEKERGQFRQRILQLRRTKPIILVHLPDDEYDDQGRCKAIIGGSVHVNAEGYVEPRPFAHFASDNIKERHLDQVLQSQFLAGLRSSDAIIRRGRIECALVENREILKHIAAQTGAQPTDCARKA